ncbi:MAG: hypothetical protein LQ352_004532 [Teloschistes flavicans]|nr:MAG: hypothetical protein LQ352_004532 [Teloschistes flavicans]
MQSSTTWSPMVSGPEDDFSNFLEFSDLQLNFPSFDANPHDGGEMQDGSGTAMEMQSSNSAGDILGFQHDGMQQFGDPTVMGDFGSSSQVFADIDMPSQLFGQQQQHPHQVPQPRPYGQLYNGHPMVPPTPNSMEMHGGHAPYQQALSNNHARAMYDHYRTQHKSQTTFTPLVSPAVTPHDAQFRYSDYAVPGVDFSPLTSPALEAQNHASQRSVYGAVPGSDTSDTTSPIDMNIDPNLQSMIPNAGRKSRRKTSNASQRKPARTVRQSPSMKPQARRKLNSNTSIPANRVSEIIESAGNAKLANSATQCATGKAPVALSQESSEAESISPEPLSEVLMPPPATPKSASSSKSPQIVPGSRSAPMPAIDNKPATPASLMRIRKGAGRPAGSALKEQSSLLESELEQTMEAITLPEPAKESSKRPALAPLRTGDVNDDEPTPTMSARKAPKIVPTSAPVTATSSTFPSPSQNTVTSPNGAFSSKRGDPRTNGRGGKKRTNSSSVQVSPALRPKISPSIKPLLPEGAHVSAETSALLLASKSNYQNLVEGTHLPGVSYPETLSTNLTSKRTSHKIAEQGRRNRINTALQEISSLLPPTPNGGTPKDGPVTMNGNGKIGSPVGGAGVGGGQGVMLTGTAAQQSNSKASTVELAIDYIKALQGELKDVKHRLEVAEQKLANGSGNHKAGMEESTMEEVNGTGPGLGNDDG